MATAGEDFNAGIEQETTPNAWAGRNKAKEFNKQSIRERTFQVRLPHNFTAKDLIISINGIIQKQDIETVSQQRTGGGWTIVTKTAEAANRIVNNSLLSIGPERELYRIQPRLPRSTLLTLPYVDPEISNDEIFDYFCLYGHVTRVTDEFYKDEDFKHVKTGRRLVFIRLAEGSTPPPYCIINNQKMSVSFRGKENVCFHCHVEGHNRAQCPIQAYKTCYNCGSPMHSYSECYEDTLVTYYFDKGANYDPLCYPKNYKGEEGITYGEINCKEDVFNYHVTFNTKFYTLRARIRYEAETYARGEERPLTTNELTKDQETNADKTQKDDKQERTAPQPTESTETHKETKPAEKTTPQPKENIKQMVTATPSQEKMTPQPKETIKRKITVTSSPPQTKKTKDIPKKKDTNITTIVINGKACTQRSLDFSEDRPKSKIPTSKVRVGRPPGNPGHEQKSGPRQRSRSRHRDSGSGEGREADPTWAKF